MYLEMTVYNNQILDDVQCKQDTCLRKTGESMSTILYIVAVPFSKDHEWWPHVPNEAFFLQNVGGIILHSTCFVSDKRMKQTAIQNQQVTEPELPEKK